MNIRKVFSPAGITSFFIIKDTYEDGKPIKEAEKVGACGGGFVISHGVTTEVRFEQARKTYVRVYINGIESHEAYTTMKVVEKMLRIAGRTLKMEIRHAVEVPIGAGYGSSGAGALSTAIALTQMLELDLSLNESAMIAHISEVECGTGLGTVAPLTIGGAVLTLVSGGPGIALIDRLIVEPNLKILTVYFDSIFTKEVISSKALKSKVNECGVTTLEMVEKQPDIESFMGFSKEFARKIGLMTKRVEEVINILENAGSLGATQNMVGEAVHAVFEAEDVKRGLKAASRYKKSGVILVSDLNFEGVKLL